MIGDNKKKEKGMTIMELMIAFFVFAIVVIIAASIFINALSGQRRIQAQQDSLDNIRYALETIAKEVRMSRGPKIGVNGELEVDAVKAGNTVIGPIKYELKDGQIHRGDTEITSNNAEITDLKFLVNSISGEYHPRITIFMKAKVDGSKPEENAEISLQTTVSLRSYTGEMAAAGPGPPPSSDPDSDSDGIKDVSDNCRFISNPLQEDGDTDGIGDVCDNCPNHQNANGKGTCVNIPAGPSCTNNVDCTLPPSVPKCVLTQADNYPLGGNGVGDACECEGDFDDNGNVDAADQPLIALDFGRNIHGPNPCTAADPCNGDFNCDGNVDAADIVIFSSDFGRNQFNNQCPSRSPALPALYCTY